MSIDFAVQPIPPTATERNFELKFTLPNGRAMAVLNWMKAQLTADELYPANVIYSIYYDTADWRSLNEKANSEFVKTKVRLRWYQDIPNAESTSNEPFSAYIEVKQKQGIQRVKVRSLTSLTSESLQQIELDDPRLLTVLEELHSQGVLTATGLTPTVIVRYKRHRFTDPLSGSRVSLDFDIDSPKVNRSRLPHISVGTLPWAVIEQKGEHSQLVPQLHRLFHWGIEKDTFSKYQMCLRQILGTLD